MPYFHLFKMIGFLSCWTLLCWIFFSGDNNIFNEVNSKTCFILKKVKLQFFSGSISSKQDLVLEHLVNTLGPGFRSPTCNSTLITAYYKIPSKHSHTKYTTWMSNFLSLPDCLVIFVEPGLEGLVKALRPASLPTLIIARLSNFKL